jgi:hypothetical protein
VKVILAALEWCSVSFPLSTAVVVTADNPLSSIIHHTRLLYFRGLFMSDEYLKRRA